MESAARSVHECLQIISIGCVCVCKSESHSWAPVLMKKYVCGGMFAGKKYMTPLHELHINQHTLGRHSLYLFLSQNVNVRKEVTKHSTDTPWRFPPFPQKAPESAASEISEKSKAAPFSSPRPSHMHKDVSVLIILIRLLA